MRCQEFEERLQTVLDERLDPLSDSVLCRHAQACSACARDLQTMVAILTAVRRTAPPAPAANFAERVLTHAAVERPRRSWTRAALFLATTAAIGTLVVMNVAPSTSFRKLRPAAAPAPAAAALTPSRPDTVARPQSPEVAAFRPWLDVVASQLAETPLRRQLSDTVEPLAAGFRPLASSLAAAIDALYRTLPGCAEDDDAPPASSCQAPIQDGIV